METLGFLGGGFKYFYFHPCYTTPYGPERFQAEGGIHG